MTAGLPEYIMESAGDAFISMDEQGTIVYWNRRAEALFGYSQSEAIGMSVADAIIPADQRAAHREGLAHFLASGEGPMLDRPRDLLACHRDGRGVAIRITVSARRQGDSWIFHALVQDASERAGLLAQLERALSGRGPAFAEILDALGESVTIRERGGRIIYANAAALRHMGFASLAELQARGAGAIMGDYAVSGDDGRELTMSDVPSVRLLGGEDPEPLLMRTVHRKTGVLHWNLLKASALRDDAGEIVATVMIIEDVTAVKNSQLRSQFLSQASEVLGSSLDYQQTLRNVAWAAVPQIADWCAVDLIDGAGQREQVVAAHRDPAKLALAERLRAYEPEQLDPDAGLGRVVRTGTAELHAEIPDQLLVQAARDDEHLRLLREVGLRSAVVVPLRTPARTLGAMTLVSSESGRRFDEDDLRFAQQLADRAAVAVDNARLYRARTQTAATLQRSLLPERVPAIEGWQVAALYRPAGADPELEVGGDFYDFLETELGWLVIIGDVTGKGVEAAALTSLLRHGARFVSQTDERPASILGRLDMALKQRSSLSLCTALCMRLEPDRVIYCSAGHPMPLLLATDGTVAEVGEPDRLLGLGNSHRWTDQVMTLEPYETLVLYTDGVTDTRGESERFGHARLRELLASKAAASPQELLDGLDAALGSFQVGPQADDTAVIAIRLDPARAARRPPDGPDAAADWIGGPSGTDLSTPRRPTDDSEPDDLGNARPNASAAADSPQAHGRPAGAPRT